MNSIILILLVFFANVSFITNPVVNETLLPGIKITNTGQYNPILFPKRNYHFNASISREVLENYLSHSITMMDLNTGVGNTDDNIRMLINTGAKFAGRVIYMWGSEQRIADSAFLLRGKEIAERLHKADPEMVLHWVICDAHVPGGGALLDRKLLLDFHAFPLRPKEVAGSAQETVLEMGFFDSIYGRSKGGITPSGWICEHLPYLVEVDNWGASKVGGKASQVSGPNYWVWGYDEMSWFAHQTEQYRNDWLRYASNWLDDSRK